MDGRPIGGATFRRNGRLHYVGDFRDPPDTTSTSRPATSMLAKRRRRVAKELAQYRNSGMSSPLENRLMEAPFAGKSMAELGRAEGMSRQAVLYHVERILSRGAPWFRRF
jgi:hypothetical protein